MMTNSGKEGRWDDVEGDNHYDRSELEQARAKMEAEKSMLDLEEDLFKTSDVGFDYQEGEEDLESDAKAEQKMYDDMEPEMDIVWSRDPAEQEELDESEEPWTNQADPTDEPWSNQGGENPENVAQEEEPVEKWDKDDDIGRNYAEPTGDDEPLDDDSYWQGRMEEAEKQVPLTSTGMAEEPQDDGTTIANSGHRSTFSDYSLGKEEAPDDIDPIFGKAEEDVSVSGPPADSTIPANIVDDEEEEAPMIGESGTNPEESWNLLSGSDKEGKFGDWLSGYSDDEDKFAQHNYGDVSYNELPQGFQNKLGESEFKEEDHPRDGGKFTTKGGGDSGGKSENKLSSTSDKDLIKSIKGGSKDWNDWGRNEKTEDAYAEIERRNREIPTPKRPEGAGGTIFRDDPDAVSKMEAKVKYLEDVRDFWKKVTKFPNRDYKNHNQLGDAKWYELSNNSANLNTARKKLEGIKAQQGSGTQLVRKTTYKSDQYGKSKPRFYYSEEPKEEMIDFIKNKIKSGTPSSDMQDHLKKEYPSISEDQMRVAINTSYDEIQGTTSNMDNYRKNKGESKANEQDGWYECNDCNAIAINSADRIVHEDDTGHSMTHTSLQPATVEARMSWEFLPVNLRQKIGEALFNSITESDWNTSTTKQRIDILNEAEIEDEEDIELLSRLLDNELEEEEEGHNETEDIALITQLLAPEADFKEDEHPREDSGKFTSGGGGDGKKADKPKTTTKPKVSKTFTKAKDRALRIMGEPRDDYDRGKYNAVNNLDGYPTHSSQLRSVPAGAKASIMKAHLADTYGGKWGARKKDYNSIDAGWKGGSAYPYGAGKLVDVYSNSGSTNSQVDYFDTDTYVFGVGDDRPKEERGKYDGSGIADSREHRFAEWIGNWAYSDERPPDSSIDPNKLRWGDWVSIAGWKLKGDSTGFQDASRDVEVKFDDLNDLQKQFEEQEKKEGGAEKPKETPQATTPAFYTQQYMGEDPDKPQEVPIDPQTGAELPVSKYNPRKGQYPVSDPTKEKPTDVDRAHKQMLAQKKSDEPQPWQRKGESFKKKLSEFEDSDRPVSPNSLMRYTEPIDLPTGKNALDQTYGVSEPETPDGQDLTGITIGQEEEDAEYDRVKNLMDMMETPETPEDLDRWAVSWGASEDLVEKVWIQEFGGRFEGEAIKEQKPYKPVYHYFKQYPFGRRAGKQNPFGESYSKEQVSQDTLDQAHIWWDNTHPMEPWSDMRIVDRQRAIMAFLRDPSTTLTEGGQGSGRRVIDEPRTGDDFDYVDWGQRREEERDTDEKARDYLKKIKHSIDKGGAKFQRGGEGMDGIKDILFPSEEQAGAGGAGAGGAGAGAGGNGAGAPTGNGGEPPTNGEPPEEEEPSRRRGFFGYGRHRNCPKGQVYKNGKCVADEDHSFADMTDKELEELGDSESNPHYSGEDTPMNAGKVDIKKIAKNKTLITPAEEGGKGSGKKDHVPWMRAIEEEHTYDFCENCSMITEQVNHKCDMCGKQVE